MFIAMDPPRHDVQRKAVTPAVAPARLADLEAVIRRNAVEILDGLPRNETFNWVERVSKELTTRMLAVLFDVPFEDRHLLPYWSDVTTTTETVGVAADMEERQRVLMECLDYFTRMWRDEGGAGRRPSISSRCSRTIPQTRDMVDNPVELMGNLMLLIVGGNDTTRNSISGGVLALNQYPDEYAKLKADPSLIPSMVSGDHPLADAAGAHAAQRAQRFRARTARPSARATRW